MAFAARRNLDIADAAVRGTARGRHVRLDRANYVAVAPRGTVCPMARFIAQAGNTVVPAVLAIESLGYAVTAVEGAVRAKRGDEAYLADDPVALLGLIRLIELRSWDWRASDEEIRTTLARFGWE